MIDIIHNPVAGPKTAGRIERVRACLAARGVDFRVLRTRGIGDAVMMAREAAAGGAECVVVVGGDGTIHEAANGLAANAPTHSQPPAVGSATCQEAEKRVRHDKNKLGHAEHRRRAATMRTRKEKIDIPDMNFLHGPSRL